MDRETCIYHPGKEASSKCKQCGQTTCAQCTIAGPSGTYCSTPCRTAHEARVLQAKAVQERPRSNFFTHLRGIATKILVLVVLALVAAWITTIVYIPVLSEAVEKTRSALGI